MKQDNTRQWYVLYVRSRTEKKALQALQEKQLECWLPLQKTLRRWSDRKKLVELPLLPGYLFVHINRKEYDRALQTEHVVCFITFEGRPAPVRESEIRALKRITGQEQIRVELSREELRAGQQVEILSGPLMGLQGELIRFKGKHKVGIRIRQINTVVMVEVPVSELAVLPGRDLQPAR